MKLFNYFPVTSDEVIAAGEEGEGESEVEEDVAKDGEKFESSGQV